MQISRLNPFGYEATTEKGNKYKATNTIATLAIANNIVTNSIPLIAKGSSLANSIESVSVGPMVRDLIEMKRHKDLPKIARGAILLGGFMIEMVIDVAIGHWIDSKINKRRAKKADKKAESLNTNA